MAPHAEQIPNEAVHRQESLRVRRGLEPSHLSLALARRLMGEFGAVVFVPLRGVHDGGHHAAVGSGAAAQLVGDQTSWRTALPFQ